MGLCEALVFSLVSSIIFRPQKSDDDIPEPITPPAWLKTIPGCILFTVFFWTMAVVACMVPFWYHHVCGDRILESCVHWYYHCGTNTPANITYPPGYIPSFCGY